MQESIIRTPELESARVENGNLPNGLTGAVDMPKVGSLMTVVYQSMRNGALYGAVMDLVAEATPQ